MANRTATAPGLVPKHQTPQQILIAKEVCDLKRKDFTPGEFLSSFELHTGHTIINLFVPELFNQEERQRKQAEEREKRAAAAERRLAALAVQSAGTSASGAAATNCSAKRAAPDDNSCSCCFGSLVGKVPFHRYNYKYCSTICMHLHSEMLQDD